MISQPPVQMKNTFKKQSHNPGNLQPFKETRGGIAQHIAAEGAAAGDSLSPYSGGTVSSILSGSYGDDE